MKCLFIAVLISGSFLFCRCSNVRDQTIEEDQTIELSQLIGGWKLLAITSGWGSAEIPKSDSILVINVDSSYLFYNAQEQSKSGRFTIKQDTIFNGSILSSMEFDNSGIGYDINIYEYNEEIRLQLSRNDCDDCGSSIYHRQAEN